MITETVTTSDEVAPLFSIYRAGDAPIVAFRGVANVPAQPGDFISFAAGGGSFQWWDEVIAIGLSAWDTPRAAAAATRRRLPYIATLDLAIGSPEVAWAATRSHGHVTLWAPAAVLLDCVVSYADTTGR